MGKFIILKVKRRYWLGFHLEKQEAAELGADPAVQNMPLRAYLDKTVVPILLQAMSECAKERP